MTIVFAVLGWLVGGALDDWPGGIFGAGIGLIAGLMMRLRGRLRALEVEIHQLRSDRTPPEREVPAAAPAVSIPGPVASEVPQPDQTPGWLEQPAKQQPFEPVAAAGGPVAASVPAKPGAAEPFGPDVFDKLIVTIKTFFTTGNVVAKVGIIVLFFGLSFLVKYAASRYAFPIELRLAAVAAFGIVLFVIGWRLRQRRRNYALILQGGAAGILYLTVFAAARLYPVMPLAAAFALMLALVAFSSLLAVLQDARALATLATAGGFLAPVLTATETGNHVALFTYYLILNAGILGIAWYKAWRILNLVGFVFTFVIAALWGIRAYQPAHFASTEPFLILFFLFYIAIAVLFAHRQPPRLKGLVDGTLVFGTPLIGFTLQSALVKDMAFGLAYSAVTVGALYLAFASTLWRRRVEGMRLLIETFLALGVIFTSLAIPFALDGRWTAAAWSIEGAGMTWIGVRQRRLPPRVFGLLLHVGGAIAFLVASGHRYGDIPVFNSAYVGAVMISLGGLFSGWQTWRHRDRLRELEQGLHVALLIWGLVWWFGSGLREIYLQAPRHYLANASLSFIALSMCLIAVGGRRWQWPAAGFAPILLLPVMVVIAGFLFTVIAVASPFSDYGYLAWLIAFAAQYWLLRSNDNTWGAKMLSQAHAVSLWLLLFVLAWALDYAVTVSRLRAVTWGTMAWGLVPAAGTALLLFLGRRVSWPVLRFAASYLGPGLVPVIVFLAAWVVFRCGNVGDPSPLPYVPILNPQDIAQLFAMLVIAFWLHAMRSGEVPALAAVRLESGMAILLGIAFIWLNALVAHGVHYYAGVPYRFGSMFDSPVFQMTVSIVWTLTALTVMGIATRTARRTPWFIGAALLAAVVVKLFLVDLADSGTITRIVSFLSVGMLMLVIGYVASLPPRQAYKAGR